MRMLSNALASPWTYRIGQYLQSHRPLIHMVQWCIVVCYGALIIVPVFLPLPDDAAHIWSNLTLAAQFLFWGIWWPFVLISMVFFGRIWCGVLCPEGSLTEFASKHGRGKTIPRWMRWSGWPFVAFVLTTIYGQLISVYQYPKAAFLILGGSTIAAMIVGYIYGKNKRVWCRYLCPVNGVFNLLARLAPFYYKVDEEKWRASYGTKTKIIPVDCAPILPLRHMKGAADCHMCGRCHSHRDAIQLSLRPFAAEVIRSGPSKQAIWDSLLVLYGLCGIAIGAFHWTASPWFITMKQALAVRLIDHDVMWPFEDSIPWWILTHYPQNNDVFSYLDGVCILSYILLTGGVLGTLLWGILSYAGQLLESGKNGMHHLVLSFIPIGGCGVFIGLSATTVSLLRGEHVPIGWVSTVRIALLLSTSLWSLYLGWRIAGTYRVSRQVRYQVFCLLIVALCVLNGSWFLMFAVW
jgi:polyferredoxin